MLKFEAWRDLFKFNKVLLDDDYNHGQALVGKLKSVSDDKAVESNTTLKQGVASSNGESKLAFE
jgi:hypothetical protein